MERKDGGRWGEEGPRKEGRTLTKKQNLTQGVTQKHQVTKTPWGLQKKTCWGTQKTPWGDQKTQWGGQKTTWGHEHTPWEGKKTSGDGQKTPWAHWGSQKTPWEGQKTPWGYEQVIVRNTSPL